MTKPHAMQARRYAAMLACFRAERQRLGFTVAEVAKTLRCSESWVVRIESGKRRMDALEGADLAALYGKPLDYFVGDPIPTPKP